MSQWRTLYLFELGLALLSLAAVAALRLPPTTRSKAFEPLDFLTFVLFAGSTALFAAVTLLRMRAELAEAKVEARLRRATTE